MNNSKIKLASFASERLKKFIKYFIETGLLRENPDCDFEEAAQKYLNENPKHNGCENILNNKLYIFPPETTLEQKVDFLRSLFKFLAKIKNLIVERDKPYYPRNIMIERQVSPEVYTREKYDLVYSNSYVLLFDV